MSSTHDSAGTRCRHIIAISLGVLLLLSLISGVLPAKLLGNDADKSSTAVAAPTKAKPTKAKPKAATHRVGIQVGSQWVGTWNVYTNQGTKPGVCFEPDKDHPDSYGSILVKKQLPGMSVSDSQDVFYATNVFGDSKRRDVAAGFNMYVWGVQDDPGFRPAYQRLLKSPKLKGAVREMRAIAKEAKNRPNLDGNAAVPAGYFGQTVTAKFHFTNAYGRPAYNKVLTLQTTGAKLAKKSIKTDGKGNAPVALKINTLGRYTIRGNHVSAASDAVLTNRPTGRHQKVVIYTGRSYKISRAASNQAKKTGRAKFVPSCPKGCFGKAPVKVTKSNECGAAPLRMFVIVKNNVVKKFDVAPCKTVTQIVTLNDNDHGTGEICYLTKMGGSCVKNVPRVKVGSFIVECPPWPTYDLHISGGCDFCKVPGITFFAPAGSRGYEGYAIVNGKKMTIRIPAGQSNTIKIGEIKSKTTITQGFTAYADNTYKRRIGPSHSLGLPAIVG